MPQAQSRIEDAEISLAERLEPLRDHPALKAAEPLSKLADQPPMVALSAAALGLGLLLRQPKLTEAGARMLASVVLATAGKTLVKSLVRRTRPHVVLDEERYDADAGGSEDKAEQSFPSGHTADAVAASRAVVRAVPGAWAPAYAFAGAVGVLQPLGAKHYPSDVAAGAAIAIVSEALVDRVARAVVNASAR